MTSRSTLKFEFSAPAMRPMPVVTALPRLLTRDPEPDAKAQLLPMRRRIWELSRHLHCSIVGTCLSSAELRHVLARAGRTVEGMTEHEVHGVGVLAAARSDTEGKLLNKALEKRNRQAVAAFGKATSEPEVLALWREFSKRGEIPGAYWAALTHAAATDTLVRIVFGEVHMLSHLVGAANRADIRRLSALEAENAELRAKLERQQRHVSEGFAKRDQRISELTRLLEEKLEQMNATGVEPSLPADDALSELVADQARRLNAERRRRESLEQRISNITAQLSDAKLEIRDKTEALDRHQSEMTALETCLTQALAPRSFGMPQRAEDLTLLYVGGRSGSLPHLRSIAGTAGVALLSHDGGMEERSGLLAGLVARADIVFFPVDCVSHEAAASIKRACRQLSKPFVPLRSSGISSFVAALRKVERSPITETSEQTEIT